MIFFHRIYLALTRRAQKMKCKLRGFNDYFDLPNGTETPLNEWAEDELFQAIEILERLEINYWLADGSLLGLYRDNALIPHDTDIDFYLLEYKDFSLLLSEFESIGYKIGRRMRKKNRLYQLTLLSPTGNLIDFCNWFYDLDNFVCFEAPEINFKRKQSSSFFEHSSFLEVKGVHIRTFHEPKIWLEMMYGRTWNIPESEKTDWRLHVLDR